MKKTVAVIALLAVLLAGAGIAGMRYFSRVEKSATGPGLVGPGPIGSSMSSPNPPNPDTNGPNLTDKGPSVALARQEESARPGLFNLRLEQNPNLYVHITNNEVRNSVIDPAIENILEEYKIYAHKIIESPVNAHMFMRMLPALVDYFAEAVGSDVKVVNIKGKPVNAVETEEYVLQYTVTASSTKSAGVVIYAYAPKKDDGLMDENASAIGFFSTLANNSAGKLSKKNFISSQIVIMSLYAVMLSPEGDYKDNEAKALSLYGKYLAAIEKNIVQETKTEKDYAFIDDNHFFHYYQIAPYSGGVYFAGMITAAKEKNMARIAQNVRERILGAGIVRALRN